MLNKNLQNDARGHWIMEWEKPSDTGQETDRQIYVLGNHIVSKGKFQMVSNTV